MPFISRTPPPPYYAVVFTSIMRGRARFGVTRPDPAGASFGCLIRPAGGPLRPIPNK